MELFIKEFCELDVNLLYEILKLRVDTFVVEQNCPYPECDGFDRKAIHLFVKENGIIVAYTRILLPCLKYSKPSIGRVIVEKQKRGTGLGYMIMKKSIEYLQNKYPNEDIRIQAQAYLQKFYSSLGFEKISEEYIEDGIPHIDMIKKKN